jgi:Na+-translocating ferredoxin:NAD+ oxidoreductase RnfE subunit
VFVLYAVALLFLSLGIFARFDHIVVNGVVVQRTDPSFRYKMILWRIGMGFGALLAVFFARLCHRNSRQLHS